MKPDPDASPDDATIVAAAAAGAARAALAALSPDEWATVTEASVRRRVEMALLAAASDAAAIRGAVAAEVAAWVSARAASQPQPKREGDEGDAPGPVKRERENDEAATPAAARPRRAPGAPASSTPCFERDLPGAGRRRLTVSLLSGAPRLDVREWYEKRAGGEAALAPGLKGASLPPHAFEALVAAAPALTAAVAAGREETVDLGAATAKEVKRAAASIFKGVARVDVRAYYRKADGTYAPTKKGVTLTVEQLQAVVTAAPAALAAAAASAAGG